MVKHLVLVVAGALALALGSAQFVHAQQSTGQPPPPPAPKTTPAPAPPLNLNVATAADLEKLPGIGPAVAARILEYRQKAGGFKKVEDLMNVRGIGERLFLKLKPLVVVSPPKTTER
jgi:competence protein ComEA